MSETANCVNVYLPSCLSAIAIDYFGRSMNSREMAVLGQYEDCTRYTYEDTFYGACQGDHLAIVQMAMYKCAINKNVGLAIASQYGRLDIIKFLADNGADNWNLALVYACTMGELDAIKLLITYGANDYQWCKWME